MQNFKSLGARNPCAFRNFIVIVIKTAYKLDLLDCADIVDAFVFMFCPHCIQSMRFPTKFECFICLKSIQNKFIPLGNDLLAGKLNYLQRGGGCCKKSEKV